MKKDDRCWYWVYTGEEFVFTEGYAHFATARYIHRWDCPDELPMHRHGFTEIVIVMNGSARHIINTGTGECYSGMVSRGDVLIIAPHEEHTYELSQGMEFEIINLDFSTEFSDKILKNEAAEVRTLDFIYQQPMLPPQIRFGNGFQLLESELAYIAAQEELIEREFREKSIGYLMMSEHLMAEILLIISRRYLKFIETSSQTRNIKDMSHVTRVRGYIEHHYAEIIHKAELARIGKCSERHLSRIFKEYTGMTVTGYINFVRLNRARDLLSGTKERITDISTAVGFNDISYFNKTFLSATGMTPRDYRKEFVVRKQGY